MQQDSRSHNHNTIAIKRKKDRIKIQTMSQVEKALQEEGLSFMSLQLENRTVADKIELCMKEKVIFKVSNGRELLSYIEKMLEFEGLYHHVLDLVSGWNVLKIHRVEYDREPKIQENVDELVGLVEQIAAKSAPMSLQQEFDLLTALELELHQGYVFAKDIELLKRILIVNKNEVNEYYDELRQIRTLVIKIPEKFNEAFIKPIRGTVEYYNHIQLAIPRMERLIHNLGQYISEEDDGVMSLNQSEVLQDSINMAIAQFDHHTFKAISGSDEVRGYCHTPPQKDTAFSSWKVNKLGRLGIGYDRVHDSEKKILEAIHKQIQEGILAEQGTIFLYTKWEPCPSCYLVVHQFVEQHPNIQIQIRYRRRYGES